MTAIAERTLYLARHGEATEDESTLTDVGRRQADLLGARLRDEQLSTIHHGPLPRAAETAARIAAVLPGVEVRGCDAAGDYLPYRPPRDELPPVLADDLIGFLDGFPPGEDRRGERLAQRALDVFTGPTTGTRPRRELVVTHNFSIAWLVRDALGAPRWRWLGLNCGHASLTVIRYPPGRLPVLLALNDMSHLPAELRWTGFPASLRP